MVATARLQTRLRPERPGQTRRGNALRAKLQPCHRRRVLTSPPFALAQQQSHAIVRGVDDPKRGLWHPLPPQNCATLWILTDAKAATMSQNKIKGCNQVSTMRCIARAFVSTSKTLRVKSRLATNPRCDACAPDATIRRIAHASVAAIVLESVF